MVGNIIVEHPFHALRERMPRVYPDVPQSSSDRYTVLPERFPVGDAVDVPHEASGVESQIVVAFRCLAAEQGLQYVRYSAAAGLHIDFAGAGHRVTYRVVGDVLKQEFGIDIVIVGVLDLDDRSRNLREQDP